MEYSKSVFLHNEIQIFDDCGLGVDSVNRQKYYVQSLGLGIITGSWCILSLTKAKVTFCFCITAKYIYFLKDSLVFLRNIKLTV